MVLKIFSHRGLGFGKEENSLESYKEALGSGFALEIDVQKTRDNALFILHDKNLKRTKGIDIEVTEATSSQLKNIIPTFRQICSIFRHNKRPGALLAVHVKDEHQGNIIELIQKTLKQFELEAECFLFDLTKESARKVKQIDTNIKVGLSVGEKRYLETIYLWQDVKDYEFMDLIWLDEWYSGLYTKKNLESIKSTGKPIYVVSPELHKTNAHPKTSNLEDIKKVWSDLIDFNVGGICTDYPLDLRELIKDRNKKF